MNRPDAGRGDWNPQQYGKFADERSQPFRDLLALIQPSPIERAVDLGCGSGELTALAAAQLDVGAITGLDNSPAMLAAAAVHAGDGLSFADAEIGSWTSAPVFDLVLANASMQWVPDHAGVLGRWTAALRPGGQLAVQVPANAAMPSHRIAGEVAREEPFLSAFGPAGPPPDPVGENVLTPEAYASLLYGLGFEAQHVRLQVYPHVLANTHAVVEWVRGTTLTRFQKLLEPALFAEFLRAYDERLVAEVGVHEPYFFPFRRILMWGRLPG
ncbi:MAG: Trans-aconitate 2-methyltransferase [Ilumatobacteraceae bacterium]|nr:Trans-aconitate 2-methyltransferase [Ilumatobacteraceae bacterium]